MTTSQNDPNHLKLKEEDTSSYEDIPVCVCGKRYVVLKASKCYDGSGVQCDECGKSLPREDNVYHCPADKNNILHTQGYDLCLQCYAKVSDEINTDNALFQIWFAVSALNKDLYHALAQKFEINSQKSLISKPTNEIFEFVAFIDWNTFHDGTSRKLFCDSYDALRSKLLSLKQSAYKFDPTEPQPQQQQQLQMQQQQQLQMQQQQQQSAQSWGQPPVQYNSNSNFNFGGHHSHHSRSQSHHRSSVNITCSNQSVNIAAPQRQFSLCASASPAPASRLCAMKSMSRPLRRKCKRMSANSFSVTKSCSAPADKNIGFAVGGSGDISTFRVNVENHQVPNLSSISFEGIFNEYYFDTNPIHSQDTYGGDEDIKEGTQDEEELPCFYPSYSACKSSVPSAIRKQRDSHTQTAPALDLFADMLMFDEEDDDKQFEHYLTVGLNSNIKQKDFARKKLNLVVVLDISGSMSASFSNDWSAQHKDSKMDVANKCLLLLLTHLKSDDRFGLVLFNNSAQVRIPIKKMRGLKMEQMEAILEIRASGGTNFESGYRAGTAMFDRIVEEGNQYENRMIFLTDAHPNIGRSSADDLMSLVEEAAGKKSIYTTFIGIGVDFNTDLSSQLAKVRGANQFSVHSNKEFKKKLYAEFDYFVSPMVFDLVLTLFVEGSEKGAIEAVYGSDNIDVDNGEIMKINTLFPSPPNEDGEVKGGIVLIKLKKKCIQSKVPYFVQVTFEDKFGKRFTNKQRVRIPEYQNEYYPNLGVRKGVLLANYVVFAKAWIDSKHKQSRDNKQLCEQFMDYFESEMKCLNDDTLKQEKKILQKLIAW